jgi:hypothetical protein
MDGRKVVRKQFSVEFQFLAYPLMAVVSSFAVFNYLPTTCKRVFSRWVVKTALTYCIKWLSKALVQGHTWTLHTPLGFSFQFYDVAEVAIIHKLIWLHANIKVEIN